MVQESGKQDRSQGPAERENGSLIKDGKKGDEKEIGRAAGRIDEGASCLRVSRAEEASSPFLL